MLYTIPSSVGDQYILWQYRTPLTWDTLTSQNNGIFSTGVVSVEASITLSGSYPIAFSKLDVILSPKNDVLHLVKMSTTTSFDFEVGTPDEINKTMILARFKTDEINPDNAVTFHVANVKTYPEDVIIAKLNYSGPTLISISIADIDIDVSGIKHNGTVAADFTIGIDEASPVRLKNDTGVLQIRNYGDTDYADLRCKELRVEGDLFVEGTTTTIHSEELTIADNMVILNSNVTGTPTENAGIEIERGTELNSSWYWDETLDRWMANAGGLTLAPIFEGGTVTLTGDVTGNSSFDSSGNVSIVTTASGLSSGEVQDIVSAMVSGNTETGIDVESSGSVPNKKLDFVIDDAYFNAKYIRKDINDHVVSVDTTWDDNRRVYFGTGNDFGVYYDGANLQMDGTGRLESPDVKVGTKMVIPVKGTPYTPSEDGEIWLEPNTP